jgi:hypothetical protein
VRPIATAKLFSGRLGAIEYRQWRKWRGFSEEEALKAVRRAWYASRETPVKETGM